MLLLATLSAWRISEIPFYPSLKDELNCISVLEFLEFVTFS